MKVIRSCVVILGVVILGYALLASSAVARGQSCECYSLEEDAFYTETMFSLDVAVMNVEFLSASGKVSAKASSTAIGHSDWNQRCIGDFYCDTDYTVSDKESDESEDMINGRQLSLHPYTEANEYCSCSFNHAEAWAIAEPGHVFVSCEGGFAYRHVDTYAGGVCGCLTRERTDGHAMSDSYAFSGTSHIFSGEATNAYVVILMHTVRNDLFYMSDCSGIITSYQGQINTRSATVVKLASIQLDWLMADGTVQQTIVQGAMADIFDDGENSLVCLGLLESEEGLCEPNGGSASISVPTPAGQIVGVNVSAVLETFEGFDGDVNNDGLICADDRVLMLDLVYSGSQIGDGHYLARADFDLNGVINSNDLAAFDAIFYALPDCNNNDNPDACDIARGISDDTNSNGIPDECEVPRNGACCLEDGSCTVTDVEKCGDYGGSYHGNGTDCSDPSICIPYGACCYTDYICKMDSLPDCELYGGTFQGDGSDCNTPYICAMLGACCFGDDSCDELTEDDCLQAGGTYLGDESDCSDPSICPPIAACCVTEDTCKMVSSDLCQVYGGNYHGYGSDCSDPFICDPLGACCFKDETCDELTEYDCHQAGGTYLGEGSDCSDPHICDIKGACCLPDGSGCKVMTENECIKNKGRWDGDPECTDKTCNVQVIFLGNTKPK